VHGFSLHHLEISKQLCRFPTSTLPISSKLWKFARMTQALNPLPHQQHMDNYAATNARVYRKSKFDTKIVTHPTIRLAHE
jgi:hypothetical protein